MKHKITDWSITATVERPDGTWYDHTITDFPEHIGITVNEWLEKYKNRIKKIKKSNFWGTIFLGTNFWSTNF